MGLWPYLASREHALQDSSEAQLPPLLHSMRLCQYPAQQVSKVGMRIAVLAAWSPIQGSDTAASGTQVQRGNRQGTK